MGIIPFQRLFLLKLHQGNIHKNEKSAGVRRGERFPLMHLPLVSFKDFWYERPGGLLSMPDWYRARELF
jgi:hypothetical protein